MARIAGAHGQSEAATALVGAVDAILKALGVPIFPFDRVNRDRAAAGASAVLGEERYAELYAAGRALPLREAIAVAGAVAVPTAPVAPSAKMGLTRREREVLRLVAEGQTDRAIAAALSIGERTVEWHLTNAFNKLGVSTRAAAAAAALRRGLI